MAICFLEYTEVYKEVSCIVVIIIYLFVNTISEVEFYSLEVGGGKTKEVDTERKSITRLPHLLFLD